MKTIVMYMRFGRKCLSTPQYCVYSPQHLLELIRKGEKDNN